MLRLLESIVSLIGLVLLSPVFLLVALIIKWDSHGPVFHRAQRVGKDGQLFYMYKFRRMVADASKRGPGITAADDDHITRSGQFIRRYKIDELPQLINVLKGDMSFVGPRPEDARYVALYTLEQLHVLLVKPGITSPASLRYRDEEALLAGYDWERLYIEEVMPDKLSIELEYLAQRTLLSDVKIVLSTIIALFNK